ncbi:MAG: asparagine synthase-related protein [Bacteroidales bacterium]
MKICLSKFKWYNRDNIWVTGYIRTLDRYSADEELLNHFTGINSPEDFRQKLISANGQFSVIFELSGEIWAATDRLRNYPLFYSFCDKEFIISDDCYTLARLQSDRKFNPVAIESFMQAGYAINNLTLLENIYQVEAGQYIISGKVIKTDFYDNLFSTAVTDRDPDIAAGELNRLLNDVFRNHLEALRNRFIAIPLSGGYDSRLIASMCAKYHPENLICYTYGIKNNPDSVLANEVAGRLGFKMINIVYDDNLIKDYKQDSFFRNYFPYCAGLSSMFFMQEYFAVKYLKEKNLIPVDTVFIPGFSGDVLAGSHLHPEMERRYNADHIARTIFNDYFILVKSGKKGRSEIIRLLRGGIPPGNFDTWRIIEAWDIRERQAKFIVNSAKVYLFFGYDYVLPFFDDLLIDFFAKLPFRLKLYKKLYDHVLREIIFRGLNLNLKNEINPASETIAFQRLKEKIKKILPAWINNMFIQIESPIFYDKITRIMLNDIDRDQIRTPRQSNYYNSYIIQWYLSETKKLLRIE